jgi:tetrahydromethanopterin S-methyltransferase subunit G
MQALSDEQQIDRLETRMDRLETKMDNGFAEVRGEFAAVRSEHRSDFRALLGVQMTTLVALILGFAGLILQHHL